MIDWERVETLRAEIGPEGFDEVVVMFLEEVEEITRNLAALTDSKAIEQELHLLKGCALNLGFNALGDACRDGGDRPAITTDVQAALGIYRESRAAFVAGISRRDPSLPARMRSAG